MSITLEADYAIRIVSMLAAEKERVDAGTLAERTGVSPRFSLKILRKLVQAGIAKSYKGIRGGYELALAPQKITLRMVVEAIDGPIEIARCLAKDFVCSNPQSGNSGDSICRFYHEFFRISALIRDELDKTTF